MKKNLFKLMGILMIAFLNLGFTSCGNDDDNDDGTNTLITNAEAIYGTWLLTHEEGYEDGKSYSEDISNPRYYKFDTNGTLVEYKKDKDSGKWSKNTSSFMLDVEKRSFKMFGGEYELIALTSNLLRIKETWEYDGEQEWQIQTFTKVSDSVLELL